MHASETIGWGEANYNPPVLERLGRYGRRIDEVRFDPACRQRMALGPDTGPAAVARDGHPASAERHP